MNPDRPHVETRKADLIILGAGPAGCAAAISALQSGLSVTILETQPLPRPIPGETLHPGVEPLFRLLGVLDPLLSCGFHRHHGIWRENKEGRRVFDLYGRDAAGHWMGFQVDRSQLEQTLRTRVLNLGGTIEIISRLNSLLWINSSIAGVSADRSHFRAPFLLDGTGRHAWLARKLNLVAEKSNHAQRVRFGWSQDTMPELEGQPLFRQRVDGWDWRAPLGDGRCAWTELRYNSKTCGIGYPWQIHRECAGPGYFLLGDAACVMDPSTANGVLRALMSGMYATHLVVGIEKRGFNRHEAELEYKRWVGEMFNGALRLWRTTLPHSHAVVETQFIPGGRGLS